MTPKQRAIMALTLKQPDYVPTMELEFQLVEELFGESYYSGREVADGISKEEIIDHNARLMAKVFDYLDYAIAMICYGVPHFDDQSNTDTLIAIRQKVEEYLKEERLFVCHGDATYAIPDGDTMLDFVYALNDHPDEMKERAAKMVDDQLERCRKLMDGGFDGFALCSDYAFNRGSFLSPSMFREFITPYLARLIDGQRKMGAYVIKHTDGDIMPIIDQIVECGPHALHSLDPQGGIDIAVIKKMYGDKVCLIGNVNCALMQTGTKEEILASAAYAMEHGKPGGGYIFSTSNVAFKSMPLESYMLIHDYYLKHRAY
jgi:uroporphyrinogen decarboxylase